MKKFHGIDSYRSYPAASALDREVGTRKVHL
jgi:hypothetical protein